MLTLHAVQRTPTNGAGEMKNRKLSKRAALSLGPRTMISAAACAVASALTLGGSAPSAQAATRCTWGGTPANPTGRIYFDPGNRTIPAPTALKFLATGIVEGGGP